MSTQEKEEEQKPPESPPAPPNPPVPTPQPPTAPEPPTAPSRPADELLECEDCGAVFKSEARLGSHRFNAHGIDRRAGKEPTTAPPPPEKKESKTKKEEPKKEEPTETPTKTRRGWFAGRPSNE